MHGSKGMEMVKFTMSAAFGSAHAVLKFQLFSHSC